jgi:hypothetical protein
MIGNRIPRLYSLTEQLAVPYHHGDNVSFVGSLHSILDLQIIGLNEVYGFTLSHTTSEDQGGHVTRFY